jgi:hypothetical protein
VQVRPECQQSNQTVMLPVFLAHPSQRVCLGPPLALVALALVPLACLAWDMCE